MCFTTITNIRKYCLLKIIFIYLLFLHLTCFAQSDATTIANEAQQRWHSQQDMEDRQRRLLEPDVKAQQAPNAKKDQATIESTQEVNLPKDEVPCHTITQFVFEAPNTLPKGIRKKSGTTLPQDVFYFLNSELEFARGQCLGIKGLNFLVNKLLFALMKRGYTTTRIGIASNQDLSSGIFKFDLLPGFINTFRFQGHQTTSLRAFALSPGDILNVRDLEQGLEQIERTGSLASIQIKPSDTPGSSDVVIIFSPSKPWQFSASLDDSGSASSGRLQANGNLTLNNPLKLNDSLTLNIGHDADRKIDQHGSKKLGIYYVVPFGNWTFSINANQNQQYFRRPYATFWPFTTTEIKQIDGKISYMFFRNQVQKSNVEFHVRRYWSNSSLSSQRWTIQGSQDNRTTPDGIWLATQYRNITSADISYVHRHHFGMAKLDFTASHRWQAPWLGMDRNNNPTPQCCHLQIIDSTLSVPFFVDKKVAYYTGIFHGQFTNTALDSSQYINIGNRWAVRGFDEQSTLAAERGFFFRNEIQLPINSQQSIYYGLDIGSVLGLNQTLGEQKTLAGIAIGLRGTLFASIHYDVFAAAPIYQPQALKSSPTAGFNLKRFF